MSDTVALSRAQMIYGLCLPLAVLLGFFLAEPMRIGSVAVVGMVLALLCAPMLIKWYHPMLILSWNAFVAPAFLPGNPLLWVVITIPSFVLCVINRAADANKRFIAPPGVLLSLVCLLAVVFVTAAVTGGMGVRSLGADRFGGRGYFYILFAIAGFFVLVSRSIPLERAGLYVALFFLPGLTALAGHLIYWAGPKAYPLFYYFPANWAIGQAGAIERVGAIEGAARIGGFYQASVLLLCFLLARYGVRGMFEFTRPWRWGLFAATTVSVLFAGYRTALILFALTFIVVFVLEGLHRTRFMWGTLAAGLLVVLVLVPLLPKLPYVVQRSFAWLPVKVDPLVQQDVSGSTRWRVEMWKDALVEAPRYVVLGKGYAMDPQDLDITLAASRRGQSARWAGASLARDYHNGPLSVYMPLGGLGTVAFAWFLFAGGRALRRHCREGHPKLLLINRLLYGYFLARVIFFVTVFGSFFQDLAVFVGLVGVGLSLNAEVWQRSDRPTAMAISPVAAQDA